MKQYTTPIKNTLQEVSSVSNKLKNDIKEAISLMSSRLNIFFESDEGNQLFWVIYYLLINKAASSFKRADIFGRVCQSRRMEVMILCTPNYREKFMKLEGSIKKLLKNAFDIEEVKPFRKGGGCSVSFVLEIKL